MKKSDERKDEAEAQRARCDAVNTLPARAKGADQRKIASGTGDDDILVDLVPGSAQSLKRKVEDEAAASAERNAGSSDRERTRLRTERQPGFEPTHRVAM